MSKFEALRDKAMKDVDKLYDLRKEAQADPINLVKKLQTDPKVTLSVEPSIFHKSHCGYRTKSFMLKPDRKTDT